MNKLAIALVPLLIVACSTSPKTSSSLTALEKDKNEVKTSTVEEKNAAEVSATMSAAKIELSKLDEELQQLQKQSNFFDYAKAVIKPEYQGVIQKQAEFLKAHSQDIVTLEGHADERGGAEYNYALGNKRAMAVGKSLEQFGVPAQQIKIMSFGKDKPRLTCHEEKCWKENRRVDFEHRV
ncbi:MAG: peptidoglycan-associated [Gallionellaceae bacterium]|nr:MAG: peptidoglycan-associated [Gallionellaceae bacterium]